MAAQAALEFESLTHCHINIRMKDTSDILFASVNLPVLDKRIATERLLEIDSNLWFWNSFRATSMLPLMTKDAMSGEDGAANYRNGKFSWVSYTPTIIIDWFEEIVFPWMGQRTRIMALMTKPGFKNNEHIDCNLSEVGTRQHKFRIVLTGNTDTLYFKTTDNSVKSPNTSLPFIMDGSWPHGMYNNTNELKITLAAGAPWNGIDQYTNINLDLKKSDFNLPSDIAQYSKVN